MKCQSCGYVRQFPSMDGKPSADIGDENFYHVQISTLGGNSDFYAPRFGSMQAYACPKCGTVKIDLGRE